MLFPLETLVYGNRNPSTVPIGPAMKAYVEKLQATPAYVRALAKGGQYKYVAE